MLGFSTLYIKIIAALLIVTTFISGFYYIKYLNAELETAKVERQRIVDAFEEQKRAMDVLRNDMNRISSIQQTMFENINRAQVGNREHERRLSRQFSNINVRNIAETQRAANEISRDTARCNEIVTGSPLTDQEKSGQVTNTVCPELFRGTQR